MKEKTRKLIMWVLLGLSVLGGLFAVLHASGSDSKHVLAAGSMQELENNFSGMYDVTYGILVCFVVIALAAILYFVIRQLIANFKDNPKKARGSLIAVGLLVVMVVIAFLLSSGTDVSDALLDKNHLTHTASKWIGAACISVYILFFAAVAAIIYVEVANALKKK